MCYCYILIIFFKLLNISITEPLLPKTLPYSLTENLVTPPEKLLAEIVNFSKQNLVPPYKLNGLTALSVLIDIK